jgi:yeast amino acid transporter
LPSDPRFQLSCSISKSTLISDWREAAFKPYILTGAVGKLIAFWECSCRAAFNYVGNEIIGITAKETERQRETLPKAVKRVSYRIIFYYVGAILVLGLNVSANDPILATYLSNGLTSRPYPGGFIIMLQRANIRGLPHVVNAVMIIAAISVSNADIYVTVREY